MNPFHILVALLIPLFATSAYALAEDPTILSCKKLRDGVYSSFKMKNNPANVYEPIAEYKDAQQTNGITTRMSCEINSIASCSELRPGEGQLGAYTEYQDSKVFIKITRKDLAGYDHVIDTLPCDPTYVY